VGLKEVKTELKDLSNKMDRKFDRLLYLVISGLVGLVAKGGLDYCFFEGRSRSASLKRSSWLLSKG